MFIPCALFPYFTTAVARFNASDCKKNPGALYVALHVLLRPCNCTGSEISKPFSLKKKMRVDDKYNV